MQEALPSFCPPVDVVARLQSGEPCFVVASGPSLRQADCDQLRDNGVVIAVNNAFQYLPWADVLYACDANWWDLHIDAVNASFAGQCWIQNDTKGRPDKVHAECAVRYGLRVVYGRDAPGLGKDKIHYGAHSGYQAINLAYLWGARLIVLLGYDMQNTGGKSHFFGDYPLGTLANFPEPGRMIPHYEQLSTDLAAEGVEVINCTRHTALPYFKRRDLRDVLASLSAQGQASTLSA